mmetsp:Transcript_13160/g.14790  ORF Transcript_13160/g.14790 Transcript_13160/m.14790 type:complete len:134 (+) Transcript_13160:81-482(+)
MKNHQGHWYNTTKEINKKFGKGDDGRQYKETELKKEYDNERRRKKRKGKKKFAKKKDAFKLKVKNNFENKEEKSSTNESTQNHAKDYNYSSLRDIDNTVNEELPKKQASGNLYIQNFTTDQNDKEHSKGMFEL